MKAMIKTAPLVMNYGRNVDNEPCLYFTLGSMAIHDPFLSSCGRFEVDPEAEYGIPDDIARLLVGINAYLKSGDIIWEGRE
jgi:hypothetical protein